MIELLEDAESNGIVAIDGNRLRFAHPLLARGVYTDSHPGAAPLDASAPGRTSSTEPELRGPAPGPGRQLERSIRVTLQSLDAAAESARRRGAPAAAAELLDLAIGLGGDTPARRIALANHHLNAGDTAAGPGSARRTTIDALTPGRYGRRR